MPCDILYQLAAPAEYLSAFMFINVVNAQYSHGHDAPVIYGGVNCRAYAKVIKPGFTIGQHDQPEGLRNINVRNIEPNLARFPGDNAHGGKQLSGVEAAVPFRQGGSFIKCQH
ncbi:Uncharacterised protein [Klebsiella pneumoniae]|nr:Uncharacterised protein [Klebsiella pneumoniae]